MRNLKQIANVSAILKNPYAIDMLVDLLNGKKIFSFFSNRYGHTVAWPLTQMVKHGLIHRHLDKTKISIGYTITDYGRFVTHACINFQKNLN